MKKRNFAVEMKRLINLKRIDNFFIVSCLIISVIFLSGCNGNANSRLDVIQELAYENPDSAYLLLRDIDYSSLDEDSLKAKYIFAKALTNLKIGRSLITDTLLNDAANYYISAGDTVRWAIATQMLSGYDFIRGESESALDRLKDMLPRIKNQELLWDTYIHLLEISLNSRNYSASYDYASWLCDHTDKPEQKLRFSTAKSASLYYQGYPDRALSICDSILKTGIINQVSPQIAASFYSEYAEFLDGAGLSAKAITLMDSVYCDQHSSDSGERIEHMVSMAQYYANVGNIYRSKELLDSIDLDGVQSVFEIYAAAGMLKAAISFKETGHFPAELMHDISKTMHRNLTLLQYDKQTALESVLELSEDKSAFQLQKQRLWLIISAILLIMMIAAIMVYVVLSRRKKRLIEAEERIETLDRLVKEAHHTEKTDKETVLKRMVLQQMGILKTFASAPTQQSEEALRKISNVGFKSETPNKQLVDWDNLYLLVDELFEGFYSKLVKRYAGNFTDKEIQLICLLRADFSTKEIAFLTGQSSASVYVRKSTIRKKLGTEENGDFMAQIKSQLQSFGSI